MRKIIITLTITVTLAFILFNVSAFAVTANPTASTVLVDGSEISFDAYNIANNNYFKLRDLAFALNGTSKQFEVGWDGANNAISLTSGQPYTIAGGEMTGKGGGAKEAAPTNSRIYLNGKEVQFTAYNIDGNNYFKLRDIGEAFNFGVDWDGARDTIVVDTSKGYSLDGGTTTPTTLPAPVPAPTPTPVPAQPPSGGDNRLVGKWVCDYGAIHTSVIFFNDDGTFIMASIYSNNYITVSAVEHFKGNYQINGDTINASNLYRYSNDLSGWRDVPFSELDSNAIADKVLEIQRIIKTGSKADIEALINPNHQYYHQPSNHGWVEFGERSGKVTFQDQNNMRINLFGANNEYKR